MVFAAIVIICLVGSLSALIISAPRVYYAMANDGLFLQAVAHTHPRFGTPANAIAIQGAIASLLVLLGTFEQIISYAMFIVVFFLGLTVAGLFVLRSRQTGGESVILTPGYPVTPLAFLLLVATMLVLVAVRTSARGAAGRCWSCRQDCPSMKSCGAGRRQFRGRSPSLRTCLFCHPKSVILWGFSPEGSGVQQLTCGPAAVAVHTKCLFSKFRMTPAHAHQLGADASQMALLVPITVGRKPDLCKMFHSFN